MAPRGENKQRSCWSYSSPSRGRLDLYICLENGNDNAANTAGTDSPARSYCDYYLPSPRPDSPWSRRMLCGLVQTHWFLWWVCGGVVRGEHSRVALLVASCPRIPQSGSLFQSHLRGKGSRCPPFPYIYHRRFPGSFKDRMPVGGRV